MEEKRLVFETYQPTDLEEIKANVSRSLTLGLPEANCGPIPLLRVVANGPSALDAPLGVDDVPTLALNNALELFAQADKAPTYWAACDPQELVADFLVDLPETTTYLVASKCHPRVFERLKNRDVRLWHVNDVPIDPKLRVVASAGTVTLTAFRLMASLGWRKFETWGWDGCYINGLDHAIRQKHNADDMTVKIFGKDYATTAPWMAEANEAVRQLSGSDCDFIINGGGMIGTIFEMLGLPHIQIPEEFRSNT